MNNTQATVQVRNPFGRKDSRNPFGRKAQFDSVVSAYNERRAILFHKDGSRNTLNTPAAHFWAGFDGVCKGLYRPDTAEYRRSITYIFYRAGALIATEDKTMSEQCKNTAQERQTMIENAFIDRDEALDILEAMASDSKVFNGVHEDEWSDRRDALLRKKGRIR